MFGWNVVVIVIEHVFWYMYTCRVLVDVEILPLIFLISYLAFHSSRFKPQGQGDTYELGHNRNVRQNKIFSRKVHGLNREYFVL